MAGEACEESASVSGACSIAYGASTFQEGAEDFYYGSIGDLTTEAVNPIRDTIFFGNQSAYDAWGSGMVVNGIASQTDLSLTEKTLLNMGFSFIGDKAVDGAGSFINKQMGNVPGDFVEGMSYDDAARYNRYMNECMAGTHNPHLGMSDADLRSWQLADMQNTNHINISKVDGNQLIDMRLKDAKLQDMGDVGVTAGGSKSGLDVADDITEVSRGTQKSLIESVENSAEGTKGLTNLQKGNYGEMKMDDFFESQGYDRISTDRVTDLNTPTHQGIDGVYYNPDGHPPYIIGEAKYGSSKLGSTLDGKQMSDNWIDKRLVDAVGEEMADDIILEMMLNPDNVQKQLVNISTDGNVTTKILDEYANVVK